MEHPRRWITTVAITFGCGLAQAQDVNREITSDTTVGSAKVFTRASFACDKAARQVAIKVTNGVTADARVGLKPNKDPRLVCGRANRTDDVASDWDANERAEVHARMRAPALRECSSLKLVQEVALPANWPQKSAKLEMVFAPADLGPVLAACDGVTPASAPAVAPASAVTPAPAVTPASAVTPAKAGGPSLTQWIPARILGTGGKSNVREGPNTTSRVVTQVDPGTAVLVQKTANDWYRVKPASGAGFEGFIRQDRLAIP